MLGLEEIMVELGDMNNEQGLPPGFRFHPTDEELVNFYLASKVLNGSFCGLNIPEVDLNRCEPWELPEGAKMGEREWYFYSLRDRKYPTGLRTNRATCAGYWKATGKDREIYTTQSGHGGLVGTKKTLVFYKGRAPRGEKTNWVMHEYRLHSHFFLRHSCKEEWAICRILHKLGEKKNNMVLQGGCFLPPLVEEGMNSPGFLINQEQEDSSYLKSLINPVFSPSLPRSTTNIETANKEEYYYCTSKRVTNATIPKVYKTEEEEVMSSFLPFCQLSNHHLPCLHNTPPLTTSSFWADFMGFTSAATDTMPMTSAPVGFQTADSWTLL